MRLFVALDIDDPIRERIARFLDGVRDFAPDVHWVRPESLHVTLKFIGEFPDESAEKMKQVLATVAGGGIEVVFCGSGFFPTARSARVFWIGIEAGPQLAILAKAVDEATATLGIAREDRAFSPHLTLARGGGGSGSPRQPAGDRANRAFQKLQEKLAAMPAPEFGTMIAHEFFLYRSELGRGGPRYTKIARFPLA